MSATVAAPGASRGRPLPSDKQTGVPRGQENRLVGRMLKYLRMRGAFAEKLHGGQYQRTGLHDIVCCWKGHFLTFEVKALGEVESPAQAQVAREIKLAGGKSFVVYNIPEVARILDSIALSLFRE